MKKLLSFLVVTALALLISVNVALAADEDPQVLFEIDCNTLDRQVKMGFVSNPEDPNNGPEIVVFKFVLELEPTGATTIDDLTAATLEANNSYTNIIIAKNTSEQVDDKIELKIEGGFTQQNGINNANDLFFIKNISEKSYHIEVVEGELIPIDELDNIFEDSPVQEYDVDPITCEGVEPPPADTSGQAQIHQVLIDNFSFLPAELSIELGDTVNWTNNDTINHTVSSKVSGPLNSGVLSSGQNYSYTFNMADTFEYESTENPATTGRIIVLAAGQTDPGDTTNGDSGTPSDETTITISTDKDVADGGEEVSVTALVTNRKGHSIDWIQTSGSPISPDINNTEKGDDAVDSLFVFTMPDNTDNVGLRVTVGTVTESITINSTSAAASADSGTDTAHAAGDTDTTASTDDSELTLQERLAQRREEQQAAAQPASTTTTTPTVSQPTNIHGAAAGLAQSGPSETLAFIILSAVILLGWKRFRRSEI